MVTPHVTEILPAWRTDQPTRRPSTTASASQRDLVVASLLAGGARRDVYPRQLHDVRSSTLGHV